MSLSMYQASVPVFTRTLTNLLAIIDKAAANAEARKFDPSVLVNARLAPDMFPFSRQIQIATDVAKGAVARLAGVEIPKYEDNEATLDELKARIVKTIDFMQSVPASQFEGSETRDVTVKLRSGDQHFKGMAYLLTFATPNVYFHVVTAYDILRHNGVDVGKPDYLGSL